jgi:hypothetical protein
MSKFLECLDKINGDFLEEAEIKYVKGTELSPDQQKEVKAKFVHRYTGNNKPEWTKQTWKDGKPYPLHFKDDADWLANTSFAVTKTGKLHGGTKYCNSSPSYPNNPELRKTVKEDINEDNLNKDQNVKSALNILKNVHTNQLKGVSQTVASNIQNAMVYLEDALKLKESMNEGIVYEEVGKKIIDFLFLKTDKDGRVKTNWGTKTPEGLAKSMLEIMKG